MYPTMLLWAFDQISRLGWRMSARAWLALCAGAFAVALPALFAIGLLVGTAVQNLTSTLLLRGFVLVLWYVVSFALVRDLLGIRRETLVRPTSLQFLRACDIAPTNYLRVYGLLPAAVEYALCSSLALGFLTATGILTEGGWVAALTICGLTLQAGGLRLLCIVSIAGKSRAHVTSQCLTAYLIWVALLGFYALYLLDSSALELPVPSITALLVIPCAVIGMFILTARSWASYRRTGFDIPQEPNTTAKTRPQRARPVVPILLPLACAGVRQRVDNLFRRTVITWIGITLAVAAVRMFDGTRTHLTESATILAPLLLYGLAISILALSEASISAWGVSALQGHLRVAWEQGVSMRTLIGSHKYNLLRRPIVVGTIAALADSLRVGYPRWQCLILGLCTASGALLADALTDSPRFPDGTTRSSVVGAVLALLFAVPVCYALFTESFLQYLTPLWAVLLLGGGFLCVRSRIYTRAPVWLM